MTDIMKLADDYAECMYLRREKHEARAALQSAIEALQGENEQFRLLAKTNAEALGAALAERDALQAKLSALQTQEPAGHFLSNYGEEGLWLCCKAEIKGMTEPLYAAPKALALTAFQRYEPEIWREDRIRMEPDSLGDWVKWSDVHAAIGGTP